MNLNDIIRKYVNEGYKLDDAESKTCQDIILSKISKSKFKEHITVKGGVVMHSISNDKRRATRDLDLDFIKYSLEDNSIIEFINLLDKVNDGIHISIIGRIRPLHHQDYDGKRVFIEISDNYGNTFPTKLDIGVHKDMNIEQDELCFDLGMEDGNVTLLANSKEQICVEKIKSLLKFGITSTRYKDVFDIYYLINISNFDKNRFLKYSDKLIFKDDLLDENNIIDIKSNLESTFSNNRFKSMISLARNNWIELSVEEVTMSILAFISSLELVEV